MHHASQLPHLVLRANRVKQAFLVATCVALAVGSGWAAAAGGESVGALERAVCALTAVMFAVFLPFLLRNILRAGGVALTFSPAGFQDLRASTVLVPWHTITGITRRSVSGQHYLQVSLSDEGWDRFPVGARMRRIAENLDRRGLGRGLMVNAQTISLSLDELHALILWYRDVAVGETSPATPPPVAIDDFVSAPLAFASA